MQILPTSALVGIALPIVLLSVVFSGMNILGPSLLAWAIAAALIAFSLPLLPALLATCGALLGGALLVRFVSGSLLMPGFELMAFVTTSLLAWISGRLFAVVVRERALLTTQQTSVAIYEKALSGMFEASRDCIKLIAADGTILAINDQGLRLAGASQDSDMLGHNWFSLWDGELQKTLAEAWRTALDTGRGEFNANCRILGGERRYWENHFNAIQLLPDQPPCILCISRDATDAMSTQQALKTNATQLNGLADNIVEAFCSLNNKWSVLFANAPARRMLAGDVSADMSGHSFWEFFQPTKNDEGVTCIRRAMERQTPQQCEYFSVARQSWLGISAFPHVSGIGVLIRDLNAVKLAEQQAAEENARLRVAQDIAGFGDWSFDYAEGQLKLSPRAVALLNLDECPPHEHKKQLLERLHPQDRMALVQALINSSSAAGLDLTVRMPAGAGCPDRHIHWVGQLTTDERGMAQRMLGAVQDVTIHHHAREALEDARMMVRNIIDVLPHSIAVFDKAGVPIVTNHAFEEIRQQLYGASPIPENLFAERVTPNPLVKELAAQVDLEFERLRAGEIDKFECENRIVLNGETRVFAMHLQLIKSKHEELMLMSHNDISRIVEMREAAAQNETQMRQLLDNLPEIFWIYDLRLGRFTYFSSAVKKITGCSREQVIADQSILDMVHPDDRERVESMLPGHPSTDCIDEIQYRLVDRDGGVHWMKGSAVPIRNERNEVTHINGILRDATASKKYEDHLVKAAYIDDTTGLPNRKALLKELAACVAKTAMQPFTLLIVNLDRFKNINDTLGYGSGDILLDKVGRRLRMALDPQFYLSRFGSDEFAVICPHDRCASVTVDIQRSFDAGFTLGDEHAIVTASIGMASCPQDSIDAAQLLRFAGIALQRAKALGRNNSQMFQDTMMLPSRERFTLENELRTALKNAEFELFYQGKFALESDALIGAEALLRWRSHTRGLVAPADFIPLLEETGLILPVGEWILEQACRQARSWYERTGQWLPIAVNVSALQIVNRSFGENAVAIFQRHAIPAGIIELEITESVLMSDAAHGGLLINTLKSAGFAIALDDFGTGYSNLSYLRRLAPNTLKIDRSFVADLTAKNSDRAIVGVVLELARALGIEVVAEGIETDEQKRMLRDMHCGFGQGYLFCRPLPVEQFESQVMHIAATETAQKQRH